MWSRLKGAWLVLIGKAFATRYATVKQPRVYYSYDTRNEDRIDSLKYMMEAYNKRNQTNGRVGL